MTKQFHTISPQQLHAYHDEGKKITLVDVRTLPEYRAGHVAGATHVPLDELNAETVAANEQLAGAGHDKPLYLTCHAGPRALQAAEQLFDVGYHNLTLVEGGMQAWEDAGLPMQRIGKAISLERQVQIALGTLLALKVLFGFTIHEVFFVAIAFMAVGLVVAGATNWCGLKQLIGLMPWNRVRDVSETARA